MSIQSFEDLLNKYITGTISDEERQQLLDLLASRENEEKLAAIIDKELHQNHFGIPEDQTILAAIQQNLAKGISKRKVERKPIIYIKRLAVAAVFILLVGIGIYWLANPQKSKAVAVKDQPQQKDILPGGNKAILRLANGTQIILDSASEGTLAQEGKVKIIKLDDGKLAYNTDGQTAALLYNTISTPIGGQYQLVLADGTKVWLNASSSLRFPAAFAGKARKVELTGEGYFEVARNAAMPFHVKVNTLDVAVLGTHFNVNSYQDEAFVRTTLLEGKVKVSSENGTETLSPGQQAAVDKSGMMKTLSEINTEEVVAWKNGLFQFESADLASILRQAERWYNVQFEYQSKINDGFTGQISRNVNLSQLLKILELTGKVHFDIQGTKVIVKNKAER